MTVTTEALATTDLEFARQLGQQLRVDSIRCSTAAGSGHPTSSMSAADLIAVLIARYLQYDWSKPKDPNTAHLIFPKGHASPLYYAMLKAVGAITDAELMTFRKFGSRLQGHPTPQIPWTDVATGSLGQGLPVSVGVRSAGPRTRGSYPSASSAPACRATRPRRSPGRTWRPAPSGRASRSRSA